MADDHSLTDDEIEQLQTILERNRETGANEFTMDTGDRDDED